MMMWKAMLAGPARLLASAAGMGAVLAIGMTAATAQPGAPGSSQWPMAGQNVNDTHFQAAEHAISGASVNRLAPLWTLTTAGAVSATPTVDDGAVYVPDT